MHGAPFSWCRQSQPPQDQKTTDTIYLQFIQRDETSTLYRYTGATFIAHKQTSHAAFLTTSNQMTHTQHHEQHHLFLPCAIVKCVIPFCYFSVSFTIRIPQFGKRNFPKDTQKKTTPQGTLEGQHKDNKNRHTYFLSFSNPYPLPRHHLP